MSELATLLISQIRIDGGTQSRAELNQTVIEEYAEAMRAGAVFPPLVVFYDGSDYWLADGFHRIAAAGGAELDRVAVEIRQGTREDAQWHSYGANQEHGLRREVGDVRRNIKSALEHPRCIGLSDNAVAKHIGCSHSWVSEIHRSIFAASAKIDEGTRKRTVTRAGKTYEQDTAKIGKKKQEPAVPVEAGTVPVYEPGVQAVSATREKAPARTYHPDRSAVETPEVPELPDDEPPIEGIAGAIELIMASKRINRVRLTPNERRFLIADKAGIQIMREAWKALGEEIRIAESESFAEVA